ncbi:MAG: biotin/lipoyl-binding protein, partial [Candidatus Lindowbacteria bacterium]|nr:biotin/lipoyl-binding protein [Candidatus Lindowbacteria bacterium]
PPLVTPTSQIVGIQAVQNVLFGRYQMVSDQVKDYMYGLYGRTPAPVDERVRKIVLKDYARGQTPTTKRPADVLEPGMDKAREDGKGLAKNEGDVLILAIYPVTGKRFLRWKYGLEPVPPEVKPKTLEDVKRENALIAKALKGELVEKPKKEAPKKGPGSRTFNVFVEGEYFEVEVEEAGAVPLVQCIIPQSAATAQGPQASAAPAAAPFATVPPAAGPSAPTAAEAKAAQKVASAAMTGTALNAPMPGVIIKVLVQQGDSVKVGDAVIVLEAMKVENTLTASASGKVLAVNCKQGDSVKKGDVLIRIG